MENNSGQGKLATIPTEIDKWNWGAFFLNWIWGIGNNTPIALLMFVPLVNFIVPFFLGAYGNAWAWKNKRWDSVEHFQKVQRRWAFGALIIVGLFTWIVFYYLATGFKVYNLAVDRLQANSQAIAVLGTPVTTGFPSASIMVSNLSSSAIMSFSAVGEKRQGTVYLDASKKQDQWSINQIVLKFENSDEQIDL